MAKKPLFYVNLPSISDETMAPLGKEACFILIPIAPGLEDTQELRDEYYNIVMSRMEELTNQSIREHILFNKSFCVRDFKSEYNSIKAMPMAWQTLLLKQHFYVQNSKAKK